MFPGEVEKADEITAKLMSREKFKSHERHIRRETLQEIGLKVEALEKDQEYQDLVLSVFHATTITFTLTQAYKIIENHLGAAHIKVTPMLSQPMGFPIGPVQVVPQEIGPPDAGDTPAPDAQ